MVTQENPAREDTNGMDQSRCLALHNAILQHGWLKSAHPCLELNPQAGQNLYPSVLTFLRAARALPLNYKMEFSTMSDVSLLPPAGTTHVSLDSIRL
ncbi:hypothetical protein D0864_02254 [Hortaea werneckii]|uniref:Uncharacterized protein n=1 Tax=Hortaea werneckii TaxID=91943 RepID=A0A3M7GZ97_HORWE|nr:hypothetical protein D0864_02254 [Hortaea werneckii]